METKVYVPTLLLEEKILELENLLKITLFENDMLKTKLLSQNEFSTKLFDISETTKSEIESDISLNKAFMGNQNVTKSDSDSNVKDSVISEDQEDKSSKVQCEYDSEGESAFDGVVNKRDEELFPVIETDGYLRYK